MSPTVPIRCSSLVWSAIGLLGDDDRLFRASSRRVVHRRLHLWRNLVEPSAGMTVESLRTKPRVLSSRTGCVPDTSPDRLELSSTPLTPGSHNSGFPTITPAVPPSQPARFDRHCGVSSRVDLGGTAAATRGRCYWTRDSGRGSYLTFEDVQLPHGNAQSSGLGRIFQVRQLIVIPIPGVDARPRRLTPSAGPLQHDAIDRTAWGFAKSLRSTNGASF